jgi:magnesium chelatase subunit I
MKREGAYVAQNLIASAIHTFPSYFPKIEKLEKPDAKTPILI